MRRQWAQYPPLPVMVAHYLGMAKPPEVETRIERLEDQSFIPTQAMPSEAFDAMLKSMNLPIGPAQ